MSENKRESLFYEYAITPDVFDAGYIASDLRLEVILVELLKGICENGMIADLNCPEWKNTIYGSLDKLSETAPYLKDKISACLKILDDRHRLVFHPKKQNFNSSSDTAWLKIALSSRFDGIIASGRAIERSGEQSPQFINALEALDSAVWTNRRRTLTLPISDAYYSPVLEPILRHASSLIIVDPYFSPHKPRFTNFLKLCLEHMGKRGGEDILAGRIIIHAGNPDKEKAQSDDVTIRLAAWKKTLIKMGKNTPHEIKVFLRGEFYEGEGKDRKLVGARFHDRYILTNQCCVIIPLGTDTESGECNSTTTWCLLDQEDMKLKHEEISPERENFQVLGGVIRRRNGVFEDIKGASGKWIKKL